MCFVYEAVLLPMSNLPNGIVGLHDTGTRGHWTGTRPGHHQEVSVDYCRIDWSRLGRLEGWLLPSCAARRPTECQLSVRTCLAVREQCRSLATTRRTPRITLQPSYGPVRD